VYGIVQQNRGHIWVYSEPGQGTTFRVYLPCADDKAGLARDNEEQVAFPQGGGTTILLVEDDAVMRRLARQILEEQGYMVIEAEDAHSALERTASHRTSLDLVLTDVVMRGMSGPELASRFMDLHPEAKFLYMSGYTGEFVVNHGLSEGIPLLEKPFTRAALLRAIQTTLQTR